VSDTELLAAINQLRREMEETKSTSNQAIALAAAANVRIDALAVMVANLEQRIRSLRVESKTISELVD
jgi:hypothetical protein